MNEYNLVQMSVPLRKVHSLFEFIEKMRMTKLY